jgi:hypothetical protein
MRCERVTTQLFATCNRLLAKTGTSYRSIVSSAHSVSGTDCFLYCVSMDWDPHLFDDFSGADCCVVIKNPDEFARRLEDAGKKNLPGWYFHALLGISILMSACPKNTSTMPCRKTSVLHIKENTASYLQDSELPPRVIRILSWARCTILRSCTHVRDARTGNEGVQYRASLWIASLRSQ